jgi:hypothetical protein
MFSEGVFEMADRFAGQPRGRMLRGAQEIAAYLLSDPEKWRSVYGLPRDEYGILELNGQLTAFTNWIDIALAARVGKRRTRRQRRALAAEAAGHMKETA